MANPKTPGDLFFEDYCAVNGYIATYEPSWRALFGINVDQGAGPDYLVDRAGDQAIVEVKHFESFSMTQRLLARAGEGTSFGGRELYGTLQASIRRAGEEQLAAFASTGVPLAVVVTNPLHSDVSFDPDDVVSALLGQVNWAIDSDPSAPVTSTFSGEHGAVLARASDGKPINRLPHVSAVIALYGLELFKRLDVYDLSGAPQFSGEPLPRTMFDGDDDRWFAFTGDDRCGRLS